jgi:type IV secretion system protein VirD4
MKSVGYLLPNMFQAIYEGRSIVSTDTKSGDLYKKTYNALIENGYIVKVFNLVNMQYSDSWNPLRRSRRLR